MSIEFTHKVTNLLQVWRIRLQTTKNLVTALDDKTEIKQTILGYVYTDAIFNRNGFMTWKPHRK